MSNIQIAKFIALVNARLCKGSSESALQLQEMWKEVTSYPVCAALVLKGDRQGQVCGKAAVKGQAFCMCHTPREKTEKPAKVQLHCSECPTVIRKGQVQCKEHRVYATCDVVLVKGSRKGEVCGKKGVCPRHNGKNVEEKKEKKEKTQVVVEEKTVQVKQEPVEEEATIPLPVVMATAATAAASTATTTTEQKKDKVVKEKTEKVVKKTKEKKEKAGVVAPMVPPPIMIPAVASAPVQVTVQKVFVRSPHTPDHPPPPHIKELFRSLNKK